eukprot:c18701_g2_i1.p1 GENE.c18701_g2_i1~~c18701_g2_i1.p1  ORF type:complete len:439 (+),score=144.27 c18701_g2_i1:26-1342(+)
MGLSNHKKLIIVNALTSTARDGLNPLVSIYLLIAHNWAESEIGTVMFACLIASMVFQTFAGDVIDKTEKKRAWLCMGSLLVGVMSIMVVVSADFMLILVTKVVQGVASSIVPPAIAGITLGVMGQAGFEKQIAANEIGNSLGYAISAGIAGLFSYFVDDGAAFFLVFVIAVISIPFIFSIPSHMIDDHVARGLEKGNIVPDEPEENSTTVGEDSKESKVADYSSLLHNKQMALFAACIFFFHTANAAMLPLLGQILSIGGEGKHAIPLTVGAILIARFLVAVGSFWFKKNVSKYPRKPLLLVGLIAIPVRGFIISLLRGHTVLLISTQLLDGLGIASYRVMHQVITQDITKGSGRFNVALGLITTCDMAGSALSNLLGEFLAGSAGYERAFVALALIGIIPVIIVAYFMDETAPSTEERSQLRATVPSSSSYNTATLI